MPTHPPVHGSKPEFVSSDEARSSRECSTAGSIAGRSPLLLRLPFPLTLALRYLRSTRKDAFTSFLSSVTAGGIAVGVAALILALAALSGFQKMLVGEVLARTPQMEVELPAAADVAAFEEQAREVPGVESVQLLLYGRGWIVHHGKLVAVELVGFEERLPRWFPGSTGWKPDGLYLPDSLAIRWGLAVGDVLEVGSTRPTLTPLGPQPRRRRVPVVATFQAGRVERQEERLALPFDIAASLLGPSDRRLDIALGDRFDPEEVAAEMRGVFAPEVTVQTARDLNRPLFFALRLEKGLIFVAVFLIVVVASLALVASLAVILASKSPEIAILGAMGASPWRLNRTFLLLGVLLAGLGTTGGAVLGLAMAWTLDHYRLISLPGDVYILDHVPFLVRPVDLMVVVASTVALTLICSASAARKAALRSASEALRG